MFDGFIFVVEVPAMKQSEANEVGKFLEKENIWSVEGKKNGRIYLARENLFFFWRRIRREEEGTSKVGKGK